MPVFGLCGQVVVLRASVSWDKASLFHSRIQEICHCVHFLQLCSFRSVTFLVVSSSSVPSCRGVSVHMDYHSNQTTTHSGANLFTCFLWWISQHVISKSIILKGNPGPGGKYPAQSSAASHLLQSWKVAYHLFKLRAVYKVFGWVGTWWDYFWMQINRQSRRILWRLKCLW